MEFDRQTTRLYRQIIGELSPPDGTVVSSATLSETLDVDGSEIGEAISDLIRFGELEFVNMSGSNLHVRIRLHQPPPDSLSDDSGQKLLSEIGEPTPDSVWKAYIADEDDPRGTRGQRLFNEKEQAQEYLDMISDHDELVPVPEVSDVWCGYSEWNSKYAILRREPIFEKPGIR